MGAAAFPNGCDLAAQGGFVPGRGGRHQQVHGVIKQHQRHQVVGAELLDGQQGGLAQAGDFLAGHGPAAI